MPLGSVLSDKNKDEIRVKLKNLCEHHWTECGYKKTNIKELCAKVEIGISTFYALFPTKEDLFSETVMDIQERLKGKFLDICKSNPSKEGFASAMKELFREYDEKPFLYDVKNPDYRSFITKLSSEAMEKIKFDSMEFFRAAINITGLRLQVDENIALGVLSAAISIIGAKETLSITHDYFSIYDFMVDSLVLSVFE